MLPALPAVLMGAHLPALPPGLVSKYRPSEKKDLTEGFISQRQGNSVSKTLKLSWRNGQSFPSLLQKKMEVFFTDGLSCGSQTNNAG